MGNGKKLSISEVFNTPGFRLALAAEVKERFRQSRPSRTLDRRLAATGREKAVVIKVRLEPLPSGDWGICLSNKRLTPKRSATPHSDRVIRNKKKSK